LCPPIPETMRVALLPDAVIAGVTNAVIIDELTADRVNLSSRERAWKIQIKEEGDK